MDTSRQDRLLNALSKSARLQATDENRAALIKTASNLGVRPVDLGTLVSYETGGSFSPAQKGPTTKWGQHQGLIQFGEPQRKQFGASPDQTFAEQMPAVERYLRASGFKNGMDRRQLYSTILAGNPNKSDVSDGYGTANEHLTRMAGHEKNAAAFLGGKVDLSDSSKTINTDEDSEPQFSKVLRKSGKKSNARSNEETTTLSDETPKVSKTSSNSLTGDTDTDTTPSVKVASSSDDEDSTVTSEPDTTDYGFDKVRKQLTLTPFEAAPQMPLKPIRLGMDDPRLR